MIRTHRRPSPGPPIDRSPFAEQDLVLAGLRRRRRGGAAEREQLAALVLLVGLGLLLAVAGDTGHRLALTAAVPALAVPVAGRFRQRATARRLDEGVRAGDVDALVEAARLLDGPTEHGNRVVALRLAAAHSADPYSSALLDLLAADTARTGPSRN